MKRCFSAIARLISRILFYWRTSHRYACRKCRHLRCRKCDSCVTLVEANTIRQLASVGVPSEWEKK